MVYLYSVLQTSMYTLYLHILLSKLKVDGWSNL